MLGNSEKAPDFVDAYLDRMASETDPKSSFHVQNGAEEQLTFCIIDMLTGGMESTSASLTWGVLYMILHPKVQERVRGEILHQIGSERLPTLSDQSSMPYTTATLMEIQRLGNVTPQSGPHANRHDVVTFKDGTVVPPGHTFSTSLSSVFANEDKFPDHVSFRPERHLLEGGDLNKSNDHYIPFSVGKRRCPGEGLAKANIFLIFTSMMQKFRFLPEDPEDLPSVHNYRSGVSRIPLSFRARVERA